MATIGLPMNSATLRSRAAGGPDHSGGGRGQHQHDRQQNREERHAEPGTPPACRRRSAPPRARRASSRSGGRPATRAADRRSAPPAGRSRATTRSCRPMSACSRSIAASGPGCGGTRPCEADRPATSGSPKSSSGSLSRRASVNTIGASSTRPTLKKTGRPTTNATSARAQCTCRDAEQADQPFGDDFRPAGLRQHLADDRSEPDDDRDEPQRVADALLERAHDRVRAACPTRRRRRAR